MTSEIDKKRSALLKAYPGYSWHEKVASMEPERVVAIFLRFERDGWPNAEPKLNPDLKIEDAKPKELDDANPDQFKLF
jgi:hypothetical protein